MKATGHCISIHILTLIVFLKCLTVSAGEGLDRRSAEAQSPAGEQRLQFMLSLYRRCADRTGRPRQPRRLGSNTVRLVRPSSSPPVSTPADPWHTHSVDYELKILPKEKLLKVAFVHLRAPSLRHQPISCDIAVTSRGPAGETSWGGRVVFRAEEQWTEMDITPHVLERTADRLSLAIQYRCVQESPQSSRRRRTRELSSERAQLREPALLLYLDDKGKTDWQNLHGPEPVSPPHSRKARQVGSIGSDIPNYLQKNSVVRNQCKLHPYRVTFRDLGWEHWIIAPYKYNPHYCKGDCPRILHYGYNSPNHAIVQNFINELANNDVPPPACVPYKYKPISVLMMEKNGSIVYKEYEDMIAESCTCR
ncbi:bone morphogenetic protein 15 isoform X2 [Amia ocellicauda]|uniref:bone morphogenetic protein 15 isoform X2 n=1 Tax=Amia ocellicauda TaxID=2972642 RepID=UPI0034645D97